MKRFRHIPIRSDEFIKNKLHVVAILIISPSHHLEGFVVLLRKHCDLCNMMELLWNISEGVCMNVLPYYLRPF